MCPPQKGNGGKIAFAVTAVLAGVALTYAAKVKDAPPPKPAAAAPVVVEHVGVSSLTVAVIAAVTSVAAAAVTVLIVRLVHRRANSRATRIDGAGKPMRALPAGPSTARRELPAKTPTAREQLGIRSRS